jgi:chromosome segregation ATPase
LGERQQLLQSINEARAALSQLGLQAGTISEKLSESEAERAGISKQAGALNSEQTLLQAQNIHSADEIGALREILQSLTTDRFKLQPSITNLNNVGFLRQFFRVDNIFFF